MSPDGRELAFSARLRKPEGGAERAFMIGPFAGGSPHGLDRGIARHGHTLKVDSTGAGGVVTSGTFTIPLMRRTGFARTGGDLERWRTVKAAWRDLDEAMKRAGY